MHFLRQSWLTIALLSSFSINAKSTSALHSTAIIDSNNKHLTVINVWQVNKDVSKKKLVEALKYGVEKNMKNFTGFISATVHESMDDDTVIVYAQWKSGKDLQMAASAIQSGKAPEMAKAFSMGKPNYHPYKVHKTIRSNKN